MSYAKKNFQAREIALLEKNQAILKLWSEVLAEVKNTQEKLFEYEVSKEVVLEGWTNAILNFLKEHNQPILDQGRKYVLESKSFDLDVDADFFIRDFELHMTDLTQKMGFDVTLDCDLHTKGELIGEPFAVVKEILIRTLTAAVSKTASSEKTAVFYLQACKMFIQKLQSQELVQTGKMEKALTGQSYKHWYNQLSEALKLWESFALADNIIKLVKNINQINNTIRHNQASLTAARLNLLRHLYCRLSQFIGKKHLGASHLREESWVMVGLSHLEQQIEAHSPCGLLTLEENPERLIPELAQMTKNQNTLIKFENTLYYYHGNRKDLIPISSDGEESGLFTHVPGLFQEANPEQLQAIQILKKTMPWTETSLLDWFAKVHASENIIAQLKKTYPKKIEDIRKIEAIYQALIKINSALLLLTNLNHLSPDIGCLLFLLKVVDTRALSEFISECHIDAQKATTDKLFTQQFELSVYQCTGEQGTSLDFNFSNINQNFENRVMKRVCNHLNSLANLAPYLPDSNILDSRKLNRFTSPLALPQALNGTGKTVTRKFVFSEYNAFNNKALQNSAMNKNALFNALGAEDSLAQY